MSFYTAQQYRDMDAYEQWYEQRFGYIPAEYSCIDSTAPFKHIRHQARIVLGEGVVIDNESAAEIWGNIQGAGHKTIGTSLFLSPDQLMIHMATVVEL